MTLLKKHKRNIVYAKNRCIKCNTEWEDLPGMFAEIDECPNCRSIYWTWLNYEEFK